MCMYIHMYCTIKSLKKLLLTPIENVLKVIDNSIYVRIIYRTTAIINFILEQCSGENSVALVLTVQGIPQFETRSFGVMSGTLP